MLVSAVRASSWRFRGRGARARTFEATASLQVERHEGGAFGERFERPWGKQWAEGPEVSVNLHWWSRRFAVQVKSYEAERACGLTFQFSVRHFDACETRAAREGIKRPCGPE